MAQRMRRCIAVQRLSRKKYTRTWPGPRGGVSEDYSSLFCSAYGEMKTCRTANCKAEPGYRDLDLEEFPAHRLYTEGHHVDRYEFLRIQLH